MIHAGFVSTKIQKRKKIKSGPSKRVTKKITPISKRNTEEPEKKESSKYGVYEGVVVVSRGGKKFETFFLSFPLFCERFVVHLLSQDCSDFALHEGPGNI